MLVVITVIGILAAMLLPALAKARKKGRRTKSINNQRQIGIAYESYLGDNQGWYPEVRGIAGVGGKLGNPDRLLEVDTQHNEFSLSRLAGLDKERQKKLIHFMKTAPMAFAEVYGATTPPEARPLNKYIDDLEIFHDPADIGGTLFNVDSCFEAFGNSYQPAVADDFFRVRHVLGERVEDAGTPWTGNRETPGTPAWWKKEAEFSPTAPSESDDDPEGRSMHFSEMRRPSNKIIQGDWNWPYDKGDTWHADQGEAGHVMLYGDGHSEYYKFPPTEVMMAWLSRPPRKGRERGSGFWNYDNDEFHARIPDVRIIGKPGPEYEALKANVESYNLSGSGKRYNYIDPDFLWW